MTITDSDTTDIQFQYWRVALDICRVSWHTPSVRDACRSICGRLLSIMPIKRLFYAISPRVGKVRFLAISSGETDQVATIERSLDEHEALNTAFKRGTGLSSVDETSNRSMPAELSSCQTWLLLPSVSSQGEVSGVLGIGLDRIREFTTEQKDLLRLAVEALTSLMIRSLTIDRMIIQKRAEVMDEAVGKVLHDITNYLGTIPVYVNLVEDMLDTSTRSAVQKELDAIKTDARLVLKTSQDKTEGVKRGYLLSEPEPTDIDALLRNVAAEQQERQQRQSGNIEFRYSSDLNPPTVLVRPSSIREVFQNIIENGIRAVDNKDSGVLTLRTSRFLDSSGITWAKIEIEDNGCGILESQIDMIWNLDFSTKSATGGYGLYRAKSVVESFGGYIMAQSLVGIGTTFEIGLPAYQH